MFGDEEEMEMIFHGAFVQAGSGSVEFLSSIHFLAAVALARASIIGRLTSSDTTSEIRGVSRVVDCECGRGHPCDDVKRGVVFVDCIGCFLLCSCGLEWQVGLP
eukprot:scaffold63367_cov61-Attheya_sp.AAC.6